MNTLVIYDSVYGNTKLIAHAIGSGLGANTPVVAVADVKPEMLNGVGLLVVGSPINAWRPTVKISAFLSNLKPGQLAGVKAVAFDTRVKLFIHGNAAKLIADALVRAGATMIGDPEGFIVKGKEGPLADREIERATEWAKRLISHKSE